MKTIRLIDLCCKAGGCSVGYFQAAKDLGINIQIVGVDIEYQPNYPFDFIQDDAVTFAQRELKNFTHVHCSPPCQDFSNSTLVHKKRGKTYIDILPQIKPLLYNCGLPGVIENVPGSPIRNDIVLRGDMFGLKVIRKRHFELVNWFTLSHQLPQKKGTVVNGDYVIVYGKCAWKKSAGKIVKPHFAKETIKSTWSYAMGIDWMKKDAELAEAIPPAYTRYIGNEFFKI